MQATAAEVESISVILKGAITDLPEQLLKVGEVSTYQLLKQLSNEGPGWHDRIMVELKSQLELITDPTIDPEKLLRGSHTSIPILESMDPRRSGDWLAVIDDLRKPLRKRMDDEAEEGYGVKVNFAVKLIVVACQRLLDMIKSGKTTRKPLKEGLYDEFVYRQIVTGIINGLLEEWIQDWVEPLTAGYSNVHVYFSHLEERVDAYTAVQTIHERGELKIKPTVHKPTAKIGDYGSSAWQSDPSIHIEILY